MQINYYFLFFYFSVVEEAIAWVFYKEENYPERKIIHREENKNKYSGKKKGTAMMIDWEPATPSATPASISLSRWTAGPTALLGPHVSE